MKSYIPHLYDFLTRLAERQDREWFRANRAEYDDLRQAWLNDLDILIAHVGEY